MSQLPGEVRPSRPHSTGLAAITPQIAAPGEVMQLNRTLGIQLVVMVILVMGLIVQYLRYLGSKARRAHELVGQHLRTMNEPVKAQAAVIASTERQSRVAADAYIARIREIYLRSVSLEEIKQLAPGARTQPLYANGMQTLLALQGWNSARLQQLRGIGPDSAAKIASACRILTQREMAKPVNYPSISTRDDGALGLYRTLWREKGVAQALSSPGDGLDRIAGQLAARSGPIEANTAFSHWIFRSDSETTTAAAIAEVEAMTFRMGPKAEWGQLVAAVQAAVQEALKANEGEPSANELIADAANDSTFYVRRITALLGSALDTIAPSPSSAITARRPASPAPEQPVSLRTSGEDSRAYSIPLPAKESALSVPSSVRVSAIWIPAGQSIVAGGYRFDGGLVYFGSDLASVDGRSVEPALIDPSLPVRGGSANCQMRMLDYWPRYSLASPAARASYLDWHQGGRKDPLADIGYVFLYFYGLERRVFADAPSDSAARAEVPSIVAEVKRLRNLYVSSPSFRRYSAAFLAQVEAVTAIDTTVPQLSQLPRPSQANLTFELRRQLGAFAAAQLPLPAEWAYVWVYNDPRTRWSVAMDRCPQQVRALFHTEYRKKFGEGLVLPQNKTQLAATYKPSSATFGGHLSTSVKLPDVSVLSAPFAKFEAILQTCAVRLDGFARNACRGIDPASDLEALLYLPAALWPAPAVALIDSLRQSLSARRRAQTMKLAELLQPLGAPLPLTRSRYLFLAAALREAGLALEPDAGSAGAVPGLEDVIALYPVPVPDESSPGFALAALMLQLAAFVASADNEFSDQEAAALTTQIQTKLGLTDSEQARLLARLEIYRQDPPAVTGLKRIVAALDLASKTSVVQFLLTVVQADGAIASAEVKALEKIFGLFGLDRASLYTQLHQLSAGAGTERSVAAESGPIKLDLAKIAALKAASAKVADRLKVIFDAENGSEPPSEPTAAAAAAAPSTYLGLDPAHAELLAVLSGRSHWSRAEFDELCKEKGLMPDGAIERINEAAFDRFDQAIIEGDDPLEIHAKLLVEPQAA